MKDRIIQLPKEDKWVRKTSSDAIYEFLLRHKGQKYEGNNLQRIIFHATGGTYHNNLKNLSFSGKIKSEKCICGNGALYWVEK